MTLEINKWWHVPVHSRIRLQINGVENTYRTRRTEHALMEPVGLVPVYVMGSSVWLWKHHWCVPAHPRKYLWNKSFCFCLRREDKVSLLRKCSSYLNSMEWQKFLLQKDAEPNIRGGAVSDPILVRRSWITTASTSWTFFCCKGYLAILAMSPSRFKMKLFTSQQASRFAS